jgi:ribonucleoside-triphosphate reductase
MGALHAVKILGSAQTNFAGGRGFFNALTFIAPYLEGRPYEEIEQLMQMFVWNEGKEQELLDRMRYGAEDVR